MSPEPGQVPRARVERVEHTTLAAKAADGRLLMVSEWGKRTGVPVFVLHGTPGSRLGVAPRSSVLFRLGVRLIAYDRPGYGRSDRDRGRTVASAAADLRAVAEQLGIDRFAVVGRSGGGPHALACAALLPDLVTRAAAMVSLAPLAGPDGMGSAWYDGMTEGNVEAYTRAAGGIAVLAPELDARSRSLREDPSLMISQLLKGAQAADQKVISDSGIRRLLRDNYREAVRNSADGWIDDALAFTRDWGFPLDRIRADVLLWHGDEDAFVPVGHSRWLHRRIPGSQLRVVPGKAHLDAVPALPDILTWLKGPGRVG
ncbi:alpha/beta fold hydrolase [Streptacidiphilus cavernicola]|uniref:Alpha/beta fold hydrolase n=1 Tax=Streptacidiphilus cavernicola TaxID=3342716 RepID=A0ABV6VP24_9ACTN